MTKREVRAYAIRWLLGRGIETRKWRGLDHRRCHFACGCSIVWPTGRAYQGTVEYEPGQRTRVCKDHQRALGDGRTL